MSEANPERTVIVHDGRMQLAEQWRQDWVVNAEAGTQVTDVLKPVYWSHVAAKFKPYDHIEVRVDTGEWLLKLLVLACERNWARVIVLHKYDLEPAEEAPRETLHRVEYKGPHKKWCVIRLADQQPVQEVLTDKQAAYAWMRSHEEMLATT